MGSGLQGGRSSSPPPGGGAGPEHGPALATTGRPAAAAPPLAAERQLPLLLQDGLLLFVDHGAGRARHPPLPVEGPRCGQHEDSP